jgi:hypothetical protein
MGLSDREIRAARDKLRQQYEKLAGKYSPAMFNYARVDERYMQALRDRLPVEHFLATEVRILKDLEKKAEEKFAPPPPPAGPSNADRMLEEFARRISAWKPLEFSSRADDETKRLAGALADFESRWGSAIPGVRSLPPGTRAARLAAALSERVLVWLEPARSGGLPRALDDLALALERITAGERERERLCKEYLKEAGFLCNLLSDLFHELAETGYRAAADPAAAAEAVDAIIYAFRLREFRLGSF